MTGYTLGVLLLVAVFILIYFGMAHRVLDRLHLNDRSAMVLLLLMIAGSFINIPITTGRITTSINIGGALIPIGLAVYVLFKAGTAKEIGRAVIAAFATAIVLVGIGYITRGREAWNVNLLSALDPIYYYPVVAGTVAYIVGRSRRAAFVGAILGVTILDFIDLFFYLRTGLRGTVAFGGAGVVDVTFMSAVIAVLLAEIVGELRERLRGGPESEGRPASLLAGLRSPLRKPLTENKDNKRDNGGGKDE